MTLDEKLAARFVCWKCRHRGADAKRILAEGGLAKMQGSGQGEYITLSCRHCGFTELYDPTVLRDQSAPASLCLPDDKPVPIEVPELEAAGVDGDGEPASERVRG